MRALDRKLAALHSGTVTPDDFIIAAAKDADMSRGVAGPGPRPEQPSPPPTGLDPTAYRTRQEYLGSMADLARQAEIDLLLTSASNAERLVLDGVLDGSEVTLAVRSNDTTDIWFARGTSYTRRPSRPFRSANLTAVRQLCDLVLYSITLNNDLDHDHATLEAYARFREQAHELDLRHFLEVFNPNAPLDLEHGSVPAFINDSIIRTLAGVTSAHRPVFLKIAYNGPAGLEELAGHDSSLIVGVMGGTAGTARDTFELLHQARQHGARVALLGRKINLSESPLELVALMRPVLRQETTPEDAVRAYHATLRRDGLRPQRDLDQDLAITDPALRG